MKKNRSNSEPTSKPSDSRRVSFSLPYLYLFDKKVQIERVTLPERKEEITQQPERKEEITQQPVQKNASKAGEKKPEHVVLPPRGPVPK